MTELPERGAEPGLVPEAANRFVDAPLQHVVDRKSLQLDVEHRALEACPAAHLAGDEDIGEEDHLHLHVPGALALLAATSREVEGEGGGSVLPLP